MIGVLQTEAGKHATRVVNDSGTVNDLVEHRKAVDTVIAESKEVYDTASLVMIPGGRKATKLYSIKPTDGTGDFTFSRNSVKWVRGKDGYYREIPVNVPALEWSPTAQKFGVLAEAQMTNLFLRSWDFTNSYWIKVGLTVDNNGGNFYGCPFLNLNRGVKFIEGSNNGVHQIQPAVVNLTGSNTFFIFAKFIDKKYIVLRFDGTGGGLRAFNIKDGTLGSSAYATTTGTTITHIVDGWYMCTFTITGLTGNYVMPVYLGDNTTGAASYQGNGTSGVYICQAQLEAGATASSPIFTDGATVTRLADVATVTIPAGVTKITTTVNSVDVVDNSPTPGTTYTAPNGLISKIIME